MRKTLFILGFFLPLLGCGGEDYMPVYFPGLGAQGSDEGRPQGASPSLAKAQCGLSLTAQLCVQIKGDNLEAGTDPGNPLCADTPPIPIEIEGERILLKGKDFPDIHVSVDVRGVATPMTINGRGDGDGTGNVGEGSWTPEGDILIQDFSFFINVLGMSGEIPHIDLTTDEAKETPDLPILRGKPAGPAGDVTLVAATVLGPLFPAADELLLGASLQAAFEGKLSPPLSECVQDSAAARAKLKIVKLRSGGRDAWMEEPLPDGNILEVSTGTLIAQGPQDAGPAFETIARFRITNQTSQPITIEFSKQIGPFYFLVEGETLRSADPSESFDFDIAFRPDTTTVSEPGPVRERVTFDSASFYLSGVAMARTGQLTAHQTGEEGETLMAGVETVAFGAQSVPAGPVRKYFRCAALPCNGEETITNCAECEGVQNGCRLQTVNAHDHPLEEVDGQCRLLYPNSAAQMQVRLSAGTPPGRQIVTLQNGGAEPLTIQRIAIEEWENSLSTGEFSTNPPELPIVLSPAHSQEAESKLVLTVTYLPKDLIGFDGRQAGGGQPALDRARLSVTTEAGVKKITLSGRTQILDVPPLQAFFATPTGMKARSGMEPFSFEEVTGQTEDIAYPVFLNVSEAAASGIRITQIQITQEDAGGDGAAHFEWLDTQAAVEQRQPPAKNAPAGRQPKQKVLTPRPSPKPPPNTQGPFLDFSYLSRVRGKEVTKSSSLGPCPGTTTKAFPFFSPTTVSMT